MNPTDDQRPALFALEFWRWLRRQIPDEPKPGAFGLSPGQGESIARQCHIEFERKAMVKAMGRKRTVERFKPEQMEFAEQS